MVDGLDLHVHTVKKQLFITDTRLDSIRNALAEDTQLRKLKQTIADGWPQTY